MAMELVETIEVGAGGASSLEFLSIPQDGVDLLLKVSARCSQAATDRSFQMQLNGDTTTVTSRKDLNGDGSNVGTLGNDVTGYIFVGSINADNATSNTFANLEIYLSNYTSGSTKSISVDCVTENNATEAIQRIVAANFPNSSAITSIKVLAADSPNLLEHSTASLYKIS